MKKVLILSNHHSYTYNLRKEVIQSLLDDNYQVYIVLPYGEKVEFLKKMGCLFIDVPFNARGIDPFDDAKLLYNYYKIVSKIKPDIILSYTIKPNLYGGLIRRLFSIPFIPNITGLGTAVENDGLLKKILTLMYKMALKNVETVFIQNNEIASFFTDNKILVNNLKVLPGSGINLEGFKLIPYPKSEIVNFTFVSRIMKDKGIDEYLEAAEYITKKHNNVRFHIYGTLDEEYRSKMNEFQEKNIVQYHGITNDIHSIYENTHCTIHPSYHEGMSNVLLETAASGRPIIASTIPGCKEIFDEGISGFGIKPRESTSLINAIEKFLLLNNETRERMGLSGRKKIEREFSRDLVVEIYKTEINDIVNK